MRVNNFLLSLIFEIIFTFGTKCHPLRGYALFFVYFFTLLIARLNALDVFPKIIMTANIYLCGRYVIKYQV